MFLSKIVSENCSRQREEALISQENPRPTRKLEPPHVGCYNRYGFCRQLLKVTSD
jgi:hypothetical protein